MLDEADYYIRTFISLFPSYQAVAEVAITIDDVNDNVPIFLHQTHEASVAEDVSNNTIVAVVSNISISITGNYTNH